MSKGALVEQFMSERPILAQPRRLAAWAVRFNPFTRRTRDVDHRHVINHHVDSRKPRRHVPRLRNPVRSQEQFKRSAQLVGFLPKRIANRIV